MILNGQISWLTSADKFALWTRLVWWSFMLVIGAAVLLFVIYLSVKEKNWNLVRFLFVAVLWIGLPALFTYVGYRSVITLIQDLNGGIKQIIVAPIEAMRVTRGYSSYYITVKQKEYRSYYSDYDKLKIGDSVEIQLAPASQILLNRIEKAKA